MSYINLYEAYKRKLNKFGRTMGNSIFEDSFVDAVNLVYSEMNEKVFQANMLEPIGSFDDIIDKRLAYFSSIEFDSASSKALGDREYWTIEWELERLTSVNSFQDNITGTATALSLQITNNLIEITGDNLAGTAQLDEDTNLFSINFTSDLEGNRLTINGDVVDMTYTVGDADTSVPIGEIDGLGIHLVENVTGFEAKRTRFLSAGTLIYDFIINEGSSTLADEVAGYTGTVSNGVWETRYIEPSTGLDQRYRASLEYGLDWHIQDGGQWALEDDADRERKWYGRGIRAARNTYQQLTPYKSPLNPRGL